jgi:hypothetical protein
MTKSFKFACVVFMGITAAFGYTSADSGSSQLIIAG